MSTRDIVQPNIEHCQAFWARLEADRPLLATWVGSYEIRSLFPIALSRLHEGELEPEDIDFELFGDDVEVLFEKQRRATVDVPWSASPPMVFPWVEAIAGCQIVHSAGNVWAEPWVDSYDKLGDRLRPRLDWLAKLVEFTDWLVELSAGRFPVAVCLMRGPADVLAAVRGAQNSVLDLMDTPEAAERVLAWITDLWTQTAHAQLARIPGFAGGYGWSVQNLWSVEQGAWFQDDALAYWSPSIHKMYAAPLEDKLSRCVSRTGYHLHSAGIFAVDELLKMPELDVIEVNLDDTGLTIPDMIPTFRRILETQRLYVWGHFSADDLMAMREELPTRGLALQLMYETPERVLEMVERTEDIWLG